MAQINYRGNLASAYFPFISTFEGRTVIVGQSDNNYDRQLNSSADPDKDKGIPQIYYCHNVMPSGEGLQSVGYEQRIDDYTSPNPILLDRAFQLRDDSVGAKAYFMIGASAVYPVFSESMGYGAAITNYYDVALSTFVSLPVSLTSLQVTTAHVNGITYLYISGLYCLKWNFVSARFELVPLLGLTPSSILGLTESNGYLIAYSNNAVAWSSVITPTDFIPSLQTGAGGGNVEGIKGNITCASPTSSGFITYTNENAVAVLYTGNARYPFQFSECIGAGGVTTLERVSYEADSGYNYAYTSKGFQILRAKTAETVFSNLTDFLAGQYFEDFNETDLTFLQQVIIAPLKKKVNFIAARYLVVSYGITSLTHAIVYDYVQKRFGKLKIDHVDCFEYNLLSEVSSDIPRKSIAFVQSQGKILTVNFAVGFTNRPGVLLLGRYQYVRSRRLQMQTVEFENINLNSVFNLYAMVSYDGKNTGAIIPGIAISTANNLRTYGFGSPDGVNHSLCAVGTFNAVSIQLNFNITGNI